MNEITYPSDEELLHLMDAAEAELQSAPPDLTKSVLKALEQRAEKQIPSVPVCRDETIPASVRKLPRNKRMEFVSYCAKVSFTAAAAAAIVIGLSLRPTPTPAREDVLYRRQNAISTMLGQSYYFSDFIKSNNIFGGNIHETK